jgi:hypothetical protein
MSAIQVHLFKGSYKPFCELLHGSEIPFSVRPLTPGVITASSEVVEIIYGVGTVLTPLAAVLIAWIRSKSSRKVIITTNKNAAVHVVEGMSVDHVERVLKASKSLAVIDTNAKDKSNKP